MIGEIALAIQSAKGSPAASSTQRSNVIALDRFPPYSLNSNPEVRSTRIEGAPWVPAGAGGTATNFAIVVRPKIIGAILYAALGAKSVSGASDPFTHTFTMGTTLPFLTAWRHFAGIVDGRASDVRISRLVLSAKAGGVVTCVASIVGAPVAYRTAQETTAAIETADFFLHRHGAGALLVEGSSFSTIDAWTLTIDTGVSLMQSLAGPIPRLQGKLAISLQISHRVTDASLWKRMIYGSSSPANLAAPATGPLTLGGSPVGVQFTLTAAASPERSLRIAIPQVALGPIDGLEPDDQWRPIEQETSLRAYAPAAGSPITATLKNSQSSY